MPLSYLPGQVPPGYEDAEGINVVHTFFESYHASGVQDSVGKDARLAMIRCIGFKQESIYDYHACMVRACCCRSKL